MEIEGPAYIQIMVPCIPGWKVPPDQTMQIGKLGAQTGLYPLLEYIDGKLANKQKVPAKQPKVDAYLKLQGRFAHLFKSPEGKAQIKHIQKLANENIKRYGLK